MLAKAVDEVPEGDGFLFEPKWDGFRALVFRGADDVYIQSRDLRPLDRYFPELHDIFNTQLPAGCVLDGEIVIATPRGLDFDALADAAAPGGFARRRSSPGRRPPHSSLSTSSPPTASICAISRSINAGRGSNNCSPTSRLRSTSRR